MPTPWTPQSIPGLYRVGNPQFSDARGTFNKILAKQPKDQVPFLCDQVYWSQSRPGVARGMHLQLPPHDGRKLVFVTSGRIHDFVIDLRLGSPTFHNVWSDELTPVSMGVFIPSGCAHGFVTLEGDASVVYVQEGDHHVDSDGGVNMSELELGYDINTLTFSERDRALPLLGEFISPFMFEQ